jgi:hypothetical protein
VLVSAALAVVGKRKVASTDMQESDSADDRPKRFKKPPAKYSGKNTTLECDVPAGSTDAADFSLSSQR